MLIHKNPIVSPVRPHRGCPKRDPRLVEKTQCRPSLPLAASAIAQGSATPTPDPLSVRPR